MVDGWGVGRLEGRPLPSGRDIEVVGGRRGGHGRVLVGLGGEGRGDGRGTAAATLDVLGDDLRDEAGQGRHLEQPEADPDRRQILGAEAPVQAATRDCAHLVIELRPPDPAAPVAEADEVDGLGFRAMRSGIGAFTSIRSVHR